MLNKLSRHIITPIRQLSNPKIALDLGTSSTIIYMQDKGIVLNERTVVAVSSKEKKVIAVGEKASEMLGKVPEGLEAKKPIQGGGIASYKAAEVLLKQFFTKVLGNIRIGAPEVIVSVPAQLTSIEERALIQVLNASGAGKVYLLAEPVAASLGANLPIHTSSGNLVVCIGAGTSEVALISLNGIVACESKRCGGNTVDEAIMNYIKHKYSILIGEQMAEKIKVKIGSALPIENEILSMEVIGRGLKSGMPESVEINSSELVEPIRPVLVEIINIVRNVIENTPPELVSDIIDRGVVLTGGTALLRNIDLLFSKALAVPVYVADQSEFCVINGLSTALSNIDRFSHTLK